MAAIIIVVVLVPLWHGFYAPGLPMDEGALLLYPELLLKGHLPYRDFETFYGPGNLLVLAGTYKIFCPHIFVERALGLIHRLLILTAVFAIARRWNTMVAAGCMLTMGILLVCFDLIAYTQIAATAFALAALWMACERSRVWRGFAGGFFAGLAILCRVDFAPGIVLALLPLWLAMTRKAKGATLIGMLITISPLFLFVLICPGELLNNLLIYPVFRCNPGRHLPIVHADSYVLHFFVLYCAAVIAAIGATLITPRRQNGRFSILWAITALGIWMIPYALQRFDFGHVITASLVAIAFAPLCIFVFLTRRKESPLRALLASAAAIITVWIVLPGFTPYLSRTIAARFRQPPEQWQPGENSFLVSHRNRTFLFVSKDNASAINNLLSEMEKLSQPGQRLFVGPFDLRRTNYTATYLYHLLPHLVPASYFLEMNPFSANRPNSRLANDVRTADWLLLDHRHDEWSEPNASAQFGSDAPNRMIEQEFEALADVGSFVILRNKRLR